MHTSLLSSGSMVYCISLTKHKFRDKIVRDFKTATMRHKIKCEALLSWGVLCDFGDPVLIPAGGWAWAMV